MPRLIKMTEEEREYLDSISPEDWIKRLRKVAAANLDRLIDKDTIFLDFVMEEFSIDTSNSLVLDYRKEQRNGS